MDARDVIAKLKELAKKHAKPENKDGMARFGIVSDSALGLPVPHVRSLAKEIKKQKRKKQARARARIMEGEYT